MTTMAAIQAKVAERSRLTRGDLLSESRKRHIARPRQISMTLCRALTSNSRRQVARFHGLSDPTTVLHAERMILRLYERDPEFAGEIEALRRELS